MRKHNPVFLLNNWFHLFIKIYPFFLHYWPILLNFLILIINYQHMRIFYLPMSIYSTNKLIVYLVEVFPVNIGLIK